MGFYGHYYLTARPSLVWGSYIQNAPCHNKYWYNDILVVDGDCEGRIDEVKFRALPFHNPNLRDELVDIGVCRPELIHQAMQITIAHRNWKRLLSPKRFTNCKKDPTMNHCSKFSNTRARMGRGLKRP